MNIAPFGICLLSGVSLYLVSQVLSKLDFCIALLDDILVYSTSSDKHLKHMEMVFKCLKKATLKFKFSKC